MKATYRGYEITVKRERCLGGWELLYFTIIRISDGYICEDSFTEDTSPVRTYLKYMRERVDAELLEDDPWCEASDSALDVLPSLEAPHA